MSNNKAAPFWKNKWFSQLILPTLGGVGGAIMFSGGRIFTSWQNTLLAILWSLLVWYTQWYGHAYISNKLDQVMPWHVQPRKRLLWDFLLHMVYAFVAITVVNLFMSWLLNAVILDRPFTISREDVVYTGLIAIGISLVISGIMTSIGFYHHLRDSLANEERLKAELMTYRYESLRRQINPHFLFNSLNVLSDLVVEDQTLAVRFIRELSDVYRYVLDARDRELVPLREELEFIETYCALLKTRFEDGFDLEIEVEAKPDEWTVPMALQLLVENAVKHNIVSQHEPLRVSIERGDGGLVIRNPLRPKSSLEDSKKVGLDNLKSRYAFFSQQEVKVTTGPRQFEVWLPVLNEEISLNGNKP